MTKSAKKDQKITSDHGSVAAGSMQNCLIQIINQSSVDIGLADAMEWERNYLKRLIKDCAGLAWLGSVRYQGDKAPGVSLDNVYTPLWGVTGSYSRGIMGESEIKQGAPVVATLNKHNKLVLTGAPGSGKSALVNYMVLCLAGELLGDLPCNLACLTSPMPISKYSEDKDKKNQPWDHGPLLPVRIILRDFAASEFFPVLGKKGDAGQLLQFLKNDLRNKGTEEYFQVLKLRFRQGKALVMFDGLDEVAEAGKRRERMLECISGFNDSFEETRKLVTCRPYAYQKKEWRLAHFQEAQLTDFTEPQIDYFITHWYDHDPQYEKARSSQRAAELNKAVLARPALHELAKRPLLLTLITYLHSHHHELPEQRGEVYEQLLDLLIEKWEKARFKTVDCDTAVELEQHSLAEFLKVEADKIRLVLERLAFRVHADQQDNSGTADIRAADLTHELVYAARSASGDAVDSQKLSEYLRDRVGILHQRGGEDGYDAVYTFPHRSFQEFLAAAYFRREEEQLSDFIGDPELEEWQEIAAHLVKTDFDKWREVILLAGSIKAKKYPGPVWDLVEALSSRAEHEDALSVEESRGLLLGAEIAAEYLERSSLNPKHKRMLRTVRENLHRLLPIGHLAAPDRVAAGKHLATLSDTRPEVMEVDHMQLCLVPAGTFFLGSTDADELAHITEKAGAGEYNLSYEYWLGRYPVTVAQYGEFVEQSGHAPQDVDCLRGAANTPVVDINRYQAIKFCDWLSQRWQNKGWLPAGYVVALPSEPEWEKAARGGYTIPAAGQQQPVAIPEIQNHHGQRSYTMINNPLPQRLYPWGDQVDGERLNYNMNIGKVSAVGCYPTGSSPYGCEEMSGNVWEWTRSRHKPYPYPRKLQQILEGETCEGAVGRVIRGGSFGHENDVRCAVRYWGNSVVVSNSRGFRVVLSPSPLKSETSER